jgi:hypothetical protein
VNKKRKVLSKENETKVTEPPSSVKQGPRLQKKKQPAAAKVNSRNLMVMRQLLLKKQQQQKQQQPNIEQDKKRAPQKQPVTDENCTREDCSCRQFTLPAPPSNTIAMPNLCRAAVARANRTIALPQFVAPVQTELQKITRPVAPKLYPTAVTVSTQPVDTDPQQQPPMKVAPRPTRERNLTSLCVRWTKTDDQLLRKLVEIHGVRNWKAIADHPQMMCYTWTQCRHRWFYHLDTSTSAARCTVLAKERAVAALHSNAGILSPETPATTTTGEQDMVVTTTTGHSTVSSQRGDGDDKPLDSDNIPTEEAKEGAGTHSTSSDNTAPEASALVTSNSIDASTLSTTTGVTKRSEVEDETNPTVQQTESKQSGAMDLSDKPMAFPPRQRLEDLVCMPCNEAYGGSAVQNAPRQQKSKVQPPIQHDASSANVGGVPPNLVTTNVSVKVKAKTTPRTKLALLEAEAEAEPHRFDHTCMRIVEEYIKQCKERLKDGSSVSLNTIDRTILDIVLEPRWHYLTCVQAGRCLTPSQWLEKKELEESLDAEGRMALDEILSQERCYEHVIDAGRLVMWLRHHQSLRVPMFGSMTPIQQWLCSRGFDMDSKVGVQFELLPKELRMEELTTSVRCVKKVSANKFFYIPSQAKRKWWDFETGMCLVCSFDERHPPILKWKHSDSFYCALCDKEFSLTFRRMSQHWEEHRNGSLAPIPLNAKTH